MDGCSYTVNEIPTENFIAEQGASDVKSLYKGRAAERNFEPRGKNFVWALWLVKSSLYSLYYAEACNELRGPSPRLSAWATQLRRIVATVASRWRQCDDLTDPGIEPQTSRTDSVR